MRTQTRTYAAQWLLTGLILLSLPACRFAQPTPITQIVEVTRLVPVTRVAQATPREVTRIVQAPSKEVTRIILAAPLIEVTRIVEVEALYCEETRSAQAVPVEAPTSAPPPAATQPPVQHALLTWYDFEDDFLASGVISDRSGNGYAAQIMGTVDADQGIAGGRAIRLYGNGYILAQGNPAAGRNIVSFALWFKTGNPEANYKLASAAWWDGGPGSGWILATHIPEFWGEDTQGLSLPGQTNLDNQFTAGEWVYEVVTYDGAQLREYTNGQMVNAWSATGALIGAGQAMAVGAWPQFTAYNFQGSIDELQIFDWTLSEQDVQIFYDQGR